MKIIGSSDNKKQIKKVTNSSNELVGLTTSDYSFNFFGPYKNRVINTSLEQNRAGTSFGIPFKKRLVTMMNDIMIFSQPSGRSNCWSAYSGENIDIEFKINPITVSYGAETIQVNTNSSPIVGFSKYNRAKASTWNNAYLDFSVMFSNGQCFAKDKDDAEMLVSGVSIVAGNEYTVKFSINNSVVLLYINDNLVKKFTNKAFGSYTPMFSSSHTASTNILENGQNILINPKVSYGFQLPIALDNFNKSSKLVQVGTELNEEQRENCHKTDIITYEDTNYNEESSGNVISSSPKNKELNYESNGILGIISEFPVSVSATVDLSSLREVADEDMLLSFGEFSIYDKDNNKISTFIVRQKLEDSYIDALKKYYVYGLDGEYFIYQIRNEGKDYYEYIVYGYPYVTEDGNKYLQPGTYTQKPIRGSLVIFASSLSFPNTRSYPDQPSNFQSIVQNAVDSYASAKNYWTSNNLTQLETNFNNAETAYNNAETDLINKYNAFNTADDEADTAVSSWNTTLINASNARTDHVTQTGDTSTAFSNMYNLFSSKFTNTLTYSISNISITYSSNVDPQRGTSRQTTSSSFTRWWEISVPGGSLTDKFMVGMYNVIMIAGGGSPYADPSFEFSENNYRQSYNSAKKEAQSFRSSYLNVNNTISTEINAYNSYVTKQNNAVAAYNSWQSAITSYNTADDNLTTAANAYWPKRDVYDSTMSTARSSSKIVIDYYDEMSSVDKYNNYDRFITNRLTPFYSSEIKQGDSLSFLCLNNLVKPKVNGQLVRSSGAAKVASHSVMMINNDFNFTDLKINPILFSSTSQFKFDSQVFDSTRFSIDRDKNQIVKTAGLTYNYKVINQIPMSTNHISFFVDDVSKDFYLTFANYSDTITNQSTRKIDSTNYGMQIRLYQGSIYRWNSYQTTSRETLYTGLQNNDKVDILVWLSYSASNNKYYQYQLFVNSVLIKTFTSSESYTSVTNGFFMSGLCLYDSDSSVSNYSNTSIDIDFSRIETNKIELSKNDKQGGLSLITILGDESGNFGNNIYSESMNGTSHSKVKENKWLPLSTVSGSWTSFGGLTTFQLVDKNDITDASDVLMLDNVKSLEFYGKTDSINSKFNLGVLTNTTYSGPDSFYRSICSDVNGTNRNIVEKIDTTSSYSFSRPIKARYIRDYLNRNTMNNFSHWQEIDIKGKINGYQYSLGCSAANSDAVINFYNESGTSISPNTTYGFYADLISSGMTTNTTSVLAATKRAICDRVKTTQTTMISRSVQQLTTSSLRLNLVAKIAYINSGTIYFCHFKSKKKITSFDFNDVAINRVGNGFGSNSANCYYNEKIDFSQTYSYEYFVSVQVSAFMVSGTPTRPYAYDTLRFLDLNADPTDTLEDADISTADFQSYCSSTESSYLSLLDFNSDGLKYIQVDLGRIYDIDSINLSHYYNDSRSYLTSKTQISIDGINWIDLRNSSYEGTYVETSSGLEINATRGWNFGDSLGIRLDRQVNNSFKTRYFVDTYYGREYYDSNLGNIPAGTQFLVPTIALNNENHYILDPQYKIEYLDE